MSAGERPAPRPPVSICRPTACSTEATFSSAAARCRRSAPARRAWRRRRARFPQARRPATRSCSAWSTERARSRKRPRPTTRSPRSSKSAERRAKALRHFLKGIARRAAWAGCGAGFLERRSLGEGGQPCGVLLLLGLLRFVRFLQPGAAQDVLQRVVALVAGVLVNLFVGPRPGIL